MTSHIYWFAPFNLNCPSTRYRGKYPLEHLSERQGISYDFVYPERSFRGLIRFFYVFLEVLLFRKKNSLIVIQKVCSKRFYATALKLLLFFQSKNSLYDLDDAEYLRQCPKSLHFFLKKVETVTVGSEALKHYCLPFNPRVFILTSPVWEHGCKKQRRNEKLHIGWVGDFGNGKAVSNTFSHKTSVYSLFFSILEKVKIPLKLSLIGVKREADIKELFDFFEAFPQVDLHVPTDLNWKSDGWLYPEISAFDVGIAPMVSHPFNQAKSAFKSKQYLSCGIPVIASDVGENRHFVKEGVNGILCADPQDFVSAIHRMSEMNERVYQQWSQNAFAGKDCFSMETYCRGLLACVTMG